MIINDQTLHQEIQSITADNFNEIALKVFHYQYQNNPLYQRFVQLLHIEPSTIQQVANIPCLPIQCFKHHEIKTGTWETERIFTSSGTTLQHPAQHHLRSSTWYQANSRKAFEQVYGALDQYVILALLPAYLERTGSSLVWMAEDFIRASQQSASGFFLYNTQELLAVLGNCQKEKQQVLLLGVTYALLDLAEQHPQALENVIMMETGGMKGRRQEQTKAQVHQTLQQAFQLPSIHSEYGMTELLSQAYSTGAGRFLPSATMKVFTREINDPLTPAKIGKTGGINIIDLGNVDTCSFIATDDLGRCHTDGSFEILGRLDASDLRGCNLLIAEGEILE